MADRRIKYQLTQKLADVVWVFVLSSFLPWSDLSAENFVISQSLKLNQLHYRRIEIFAIISL